MDAAIRSFELAASQGSSSAELWSDLAAGHLVRAQLEDDPLDLLHALELAERALELDPALPEARFNRALALDELHFLNLARDAWDAYLEVDAASGWAAEAVARRELTRSEPPEDSGDSARAGWRQAAEAGDAAAVREMVSRHRSASRAWAEEKLLAAWARDLDREQAAARRALAAARAVGEALAELGGDTLLRDAIAALDRAAEDPVALRRLATGHRAYASAQAMMDQGHFEAARRSLATALAAFPSDYPFRGWVRFADLRCAYRSGRHKEAARLAQRLLADIPDSLPDVPEVDRQAAVRTAAPYPMLLGRTYWVLGTTLMALGRPGPAEAAYLAAAEHLERAGESEGLIAVETFLAGVYDELGDAREAWRWRLKVLRLLELRPQPRRLRLALTGAAFSAADLGERRAALRLAGGALALAREQRLSEPPLADAAAVATHLWHRAGFLRLSGRPGAALENLREARALCREVVSEEDVSTLWPEILFEEARSLALTRPPEALAPLAEAESLFRGTESLYFLPEVLLQRARLLRQIEDLAGAEAALDEAVEVLKRQRSDVGRLEHQLALFNRNGDVWDERLALLVARGAPPRQLLAAVEEGRAQVLLGWMNAAAPLPSGQLAAADWLVLPDLPPGTIALEYELLEDRLLLWVLREGAVRLEIRSVDPQVLEGEVEAFRDGLQRGSEDAARSEALWRLLLAPAEAELRGAAELVIAADGVLHGLPFVALRDPASGRRLIEDHRLVFAPSLRVYGQLRGFRPLGDLRSARFLVVADPAFDRRRHRLTPLDGARFEAQAVAGRFAATEVLEGAGATPSAVLAGLASAEVFHYAGHALAHRRDPLGSSLVLAPEPGEPGSGALPARRLLEVPLAETRLAVLSACDTAWGGAPSREGVVGLVWPFLARGVPSVVASLWPVQDPSTAELFDTFYDALATGEDPAGALRSAQLAQAALGRSFDWAAFQLYGAGDG